MRLILAAAFLTASPAFAGVNEALDNDILPGFSAFAAATADFAQAAQEDCTAPALAAPFNTAFDAWMEVSGVRIGPSEHAADAIAFWPDRRGFTQKTLAGLIRSEDPVIDDPVAFSELSVAGRGFFSLDMLLFDPAFSDYQAGSYSCHLAERITADLADQAATLEIDWKDGFAETLRRAGAPDNATYLSPEEAMRALYTQVLSSLEFTHDTRLGEPLGTLDEPRPKRAEARRSGRSLTNAVEAVDAAVDLAEALADWEMPKTATALTRVHEAAAKIDDPSFADIDDPTAHLRLEVLAQKVQGVETAIEEELGLVLGLTPGFNSQDGD